MKKQDNTVNEATLLRLLAEEKLKNQISTEENLITESDNLKLIHELQVHQIELEMQNEELLKAQEQTVIMTEKYVDLYDFAPCGFVTLSKEGDIIDLNFSASEMLGKNRIQLKNTRFGLHISHDSLNVYNQTLEKAFANNQKETCELILLHKTDKKDQSMYVRVDAIVSKNTNKCLFTMIDISESKKMEAALQKSMTQLKDLNDYFTGRELRMMDLKKEINELLIKSGCEKEYLI